MQSISYKLVQGWLFVCINYLVVFSSLVSTQENVYPLGDNFPFGIYSVDTLRDMQIVKGLGYNLVQSYKNAQDLISTQKWLEEINSLGLKAVLSIDTSLFKWQEMNFSIFDQYILEFASNPNIAWWALPEELRFWRANELLLIKYLSNKINDYDVHKRPKYMYLPNHYDSLALRQYMDYLDILGAGAYTNYAKKPRDWIYWRMKQQEVALASKPAELHRPKPRSIALLQLFRFGDSKELSFEDAYHDFYASLVGGAKGILIYSYAYRNQSWLAFQAYNKAVSEISSRKDLQSALLYGHDCQNVKVYEHENDISHELVAMNKTASDTSKWQESNFRFWQFKSKCFGLIVNSSNGQKKISIGHSDNKQIEIMNNNINLYREQSKTTLFLQQLAVALVEIKEVH